MAYDRPVVGYGANCVNTLRLWAAAAPESFDFAEFSQGDFAGSVINNVAAESRHARAVPRRLDRGGPHAALPAAVLPGELLAAGHHGARCSRAGRELVIACRSCVAVQMNDTHPALCVAELMRILLDQAHLPWEQAWDITLRTLAYTNHTLLPEALEQWPVEPVRGAHPAAAGDHLRDQSALPR